MKANPNRPAELANAFLELARILVEAALSEHEIDSVERLSARWRLSRRALQYRCRAARVTARECVQFVQCLRAVLTQDDDWIPEALLPFCDPRTLKKLMYQGCLFEGARPDLQDFVRSQRFILNTALVDAIITQLTSRRDIAFTSASFAVEPAGKRC